MLRINETIDSQNSNASSRDPRGMWPTALLRLFEPELFNITQNCVSQAAALVNSINLSVGTACFDHQIQLSGAAFFNQCRCNLPRLCAGG